MAESTKPPGAQQNEVGFLDDFETLTRFRQNITSNLARIETENTGRIRQQDVDFLDLVSITCEVYQSSGPDILIPMDHLGTNEEYTVDAGHTSVVTSRFITGGKVLSRTTRGETKPKEGWVVVKRARRHQGDRGAGDWMRAFVTELRVISHPPLRGHPNIVKIKGIAWDFENHDITPSPVMLIEYAPHESLDKFWRDHELAETPFATKLKLCLDVGEGIKALHGCGIAHGDIKPANILIYPADPFTAKLTDFGHSVIKADANPRLIGWTPPWEAPEIHQLSGEGADITFEDIMATDVFSYGLVAASIIIGRSVVSSGLNGLATLSAISSAKTDDRLMDLVLDAISEEDKEKSDSDFDFAVVESLLHCCLKKQPSWRSISGCVEVIREYERRRSSQEDMHASSWEIKHIPRPLEAVNCTRRPILGYHTLAGTSCIFKSRIVSELHRSATDDSDPRRAACTWELFVCYFCGFGVEKDWVQARHWLTEAAFLGVASAQAFFYRLHLSMGADPIHSLVTYQPTYANENVSPSPANATALLANWLSLAISAGCVDVIQDMRHLDRSYACSYLDGTLERVRATLGVSMSFTAGQAMPDILASAIAGDVEQMRAALEVDPNALTRVDEMGNNAVILAAKYGNTNCLRFLLGHPSTRANHRNREQQTVLHFMSVFTPQEIREFVPILLEKGADPAQEGGPVVYSTQAPGFSLPIRCDALMNAVIRPNMVLLETLLLAGHVEGRNQSQCRLCAGGTRLRKMFALAFSLCSYEAIDMFERHLELHGKADDCLNYELMNVWYRNELIPLSEAPLHGILLCGLDLPKPFLDAVYHGPKYSHCVPRTLEKALRRIKDDDAGQVLYSLIRQSVRYGTADSLEYLLSTNKGRVGGLEIAEYALKPTESFYDNPILMSIRLGFREGFLKLTDAAYGNTSLGLLQTHSAKSKDRLRAKMARKVHTFNMAHACLTAAVLAEHRDTFFVEHILRVSREEHILARPDLTDWLVGGDWPTFMGHAIFALAKGSLHLLLDKYPVLLDQSFRMIGASENQLLRSKDSFYRTLYSLLKHPIKSGREISVTSYVLLLGSSETCQLLQTLINKYRPGKPLRTLSSRSLVSSRAREVNSADHVPVMGNTTDLYTGPSESPDSPLTSLEMDWLLTGLIADDRQDRYLLWLTIVQRQLDLGYHGGCLDIHYLRLAVRHGNSTAVERICQISRPSALKPGDMFLEALLPVADLALLMERGHVHPFSLCQHDDPFPLRPSTREKTSLARVSSILAGHSFRTSWVFRLFVVHYPRASFIIGIVLLAFVFFPLSIIPPVVLHADRTPRHPGGWSSIHPATIVWFMILNIIFSFCILGWGRMVVVTIISFTALGCNRYRTLHKRSGLIERYFRAVFIAAFGLMWFVGYIWYLTSRDGATDLRDPNGLDPGFGAFGLYIFLPGLPFVIAAYGHKIGKFFGSFRKGKKPGETDGKSRQIVTWLSL